jgi:3-deoxy-D-manno-octulosonic-acid transferase
VTDRARQIQSGNRPGFGAFLLLLVYNILVTLVLLVALPVVIPLVIASTKRRQTLRQRLGWWRYPWQAMHARPARAKVWVHALSVGEVLAAQPLVKGINDRYPQLQVVVTVSTLTGFQTASRLFAGTSVELAYFPYDWIGSVRTVADKIGARAVILVETDIWPNFLAEMKRRHVPVYLVNLRLSDKAWKSFRRFKWLAGKLFGAFEKICVQTPFDALRLTRVGIAKERLCVTGNIKFDGVATTAAGDVAAHWRKRLQLASTQKIVVAGSTHEGEELLLLDAFLALKQAGRALCLILAPRDPNRAPHLLAWCHQKGVSADRLSELSGNTGDHGPDVIVVDFIGPLKELYSLADVAFVGGSLVKEGGHNPLEPAVFGRAIVFGPDMRDFRQIAAWLLTAGGARQVAHQAELTTTLSLLLDDGQLAASMGERARQVVMQHQGAVAQTLKSLDLLITHNAN